jgi:hypothetical protein
MSYHDRQSSLVEEKCFVDGYGFASWRVTRGLGVTWYRLETWGPKDLIGITREYYGTEELFNAIERFESIHDKVTA